MTVHFLSGLWTTAAPALGDHLWQSTGCVVVAALLTLTLRRNQARVRYRIWLAASIKFLVPFSVLVALGNRFAWRHISSAGGALYFAIEQAGQPFTKAAPAVVQAAPAPALTRMLHLLPIAGGVWLCGFLTVVGIWAARWLRIRAAAAQAVPRRDGREIDALRRLLASGTTSHEIGILLSRTSLEPGIFGIVRPVLLWPEGLSEKLDDVHLEAVIAHELCHVRRRDNLTAAVHMLVEAAFWFHPLVWWLGARLIDERERACDEEVLQRGSEPHLYAESILKICEFCLGSPLTCVSGVTGADLKKRMVHIMTDHVIRNLNFPRKLLLWTAACLAIALPIAFGLLNATPGHAQGQLAATPKFVSVSIKPHPSEGNGLVMSRMMMSPINGAFTAKNVSPHSLLQIAYRIQDTQLAGEPDWFKSTTYDIDAKVDPSVVEEMHKLSDDQRNLVNQQMLQQFLTDYFKVTLHQESRDLPVYELLIAEGGPKLQKVDKHGFMHMGVGEVSSQGTPLTLLTAQLSQRLGRTVVDKTGLDGDYAFNLHWIPDAEEQARIRAAGLPPALMKAEQPAASGPPLLTALEEQLGLKLQPQTERVQVLVIDHAEQPSQDN
ncbi:MAG TPA: M56 family metallopeptidase [Terriglobales bacterium]|nr:M56 family metallopeptidase [Terriglobales bacterium]